jgi:hypothetical protein
VIGLVTLDFVLWIVGGCVVRVALVSNVACVHPDDFAGDVSCLRVPSDVITNFEFMRHGLFMTKFCFASSLRSESLCPKKLKQSTRGKIFYIALCE